MIISCPLIISSLLTKQAFTNTKGDQMSLKVNTHIVNAVPEYIEPIADSNESEAYKKSVNDVCNSYFNPGAEVQGGNKSSLEHRTQAGEGFADEYRILTNAVRSKL